MDKQLSLFKEKEGGVFDYTTDMRFNGPDYDPKYDKLRLTGQISDIFNLMRDGKWRTLGEIATITRHHEASISAQLRHLRKERFGSHTIEKQSRGDRKAGLWEYKLSINKDTL